MALVDLKPNLAQPVAIWPAQIIIDPLQSEEKIFPFIAIRIRAIYANPLQPKQATVNTRRMLYLRTNNVVNG